MGELVASLEDELPAEIRHKLLGLAAERNRVVHKAQALGEARLEVFLADAEEVTAYLEPLVAEQLATGHVSGALPLRAPPPIALAPGERAAGNLFDTARFAPVHPGQRTFSPPAGHPARKEADQRVAAQRAARQPWFSAWWWPLMLLTVVLAWAGHARERPSLLLIFPLLVPAVYQGLRRPAPAWSVRARTTAFVVFWLLMFAATYVLVFARV